MRRMTIAVALVGAIGLTGCATQMMEASQRQCSAFGFAPGTVEFANCTQQDFARRQAAMQNMGASMQRLGDSMQTPQRSSFDLPSPPVEQAPPAYSAGGIGILQGQRTVGMSKICSYNRLGSPYVITVGAADLCPLSPP